MMKTFAASIKMTAGGVALLALTACSTVPPKPQGLDLVREKLTHLQANAELASRAPVEIKDAELAVSTAEQPESNAVIANYRVLMADRTVEIATARAQSRLLVDQRKELSDQAGQVRLDARTREADLARYDANAARNDADAAKLQAAELRNQIAELNARETERGLVMTLGDVLFATGKSDLKAGTEVDLDKLVAFLVKYDDRTLLIEGYTDNVGQADYNLALSQRRADAVKNYLLRQGINNGRLSAYGKGESSPVADNDSSTGRQMNRRVEVIISNSIASAN